MLRRMRPAALMRASLSWVALLAILPAPTRGQATDSRRFDARRLRLVVDSFNKYLIYNGDTVHQGGALDELRAQGQRLTRIWLDADRSLGPLADTIVSSFRDLRPLENRMHFPNITGQEFFQWTGVSGWTRREHGDSTPLDVPLRRLVYDPANFDVLVRASDLREGLAIDIPAFEVSKNRVINLRGKVTGSATVDGHSCWVFTGDNGGVTVTFWIEKETRAMRRMLLEASPGRGLLLVAGDPTWRELHSDEGGFSAQFPAEPRYSERLDSVSGLRFHRFRVEDSVFAFFVGYADYLPDEIGRRGTRGMLNADRDAFLRAVKGQISNEHDVICGGHPGRGFVVRKEGGEWHSVKLCFANPRMYVASLNSIGGPASDELVLHFLNSFRIVNGRN